MASEPHYCDGNGLCVKRLASTRHPDPTPLVEALGELEQRATATLSAMDRYNEQNGTHIIGPSLLQLGKSIAHARAALTQWEKTNG